MLSHSNFLSFLAGLVAHPAIAGWKEDDTYLSFLPLPHVLERVVIISMIHRGCFVAYLFFNVDFMVGTY
jgi:long-chain acyl-CoA synthetase